MTRDIDAQLDTRQLRRMRAEDKALGKLERLEKLAEPLIGELQGETGFRYYINLLDRHGRFTGKTKESRSYGELIAYAIRNGYVG